MLPFILQTVIAGAILFASAAAQIGSNSTLNLGYARYRGLHNTTLGITGYYGLRYAAAPTGDLRWRAPVPIEKQSNVSFAIIDAMARGPRCHQSAAPAIFALDAILPVVSVVSPYTPLFPGPSTVMSEDCLLVDVVIPDNPVSSALPIVVQFHGGGYTVGDSSIAAGEVLVSRSNGSLISVSVQYRLGPWGFLAGDEVSSNGTINVGLLDQRLALEWVQRYASLFGGDPLKVTITGSSAGGGSVSCQLILYGGDPNPPFRAAAPEYPWFQPYHDQATLSQQYRYLLQASNCSDLNCLRTLNESALSTASDLTYILAYDAGQYGYGDFYFGPSVDGEIVRDLPSNEYKRGHFSKVPLLIDHNSYEGFLFSNLSLTTRSEEFSDLENLWPSSTASFFTRLFQLYPATSFESSYFPANPFTSLAGELFPSIANNSVFWQRQTLFGDFIISCFTYYIARAFSDAGMPVYKLIFNAVFPIHGGIAPFIFTEPSGTANATLASIVQDYYLNFFVSLDPNALSGVQKPVIWPTYQQDTFTVDSTTTTGSFQIIQINDTAIYTRADPDASAQCDFFHAESYIVRN